METDSLRIHNTQTPYGRKTFVCSFQEILSCPLDLNPQGLISLTVSLPNLRELWSPVISDCPELRVLELYIPRSVIEHPIPKDNLFSNIPVSYAENCLSLTSVFLHIL